MPDLPLQRGAVVMRGRRCSVVWEVRGLFLILLPILEPRLPKAGDVPLELADMVACGVAMPRATIRPRASEPVSSGGHSVIGAVPGRTMCRVVAGVIRVAAEADTVRRWSGREERIERSAEKCVNLARE